MPPTRIGFLGAGDIAARHAQGFRSAGDVRFAAVFDPVRERGESFARDFGAARVADSAASLFEADDVDVLVILSPHVYHADQAVAALRAGKDVICEKPMATTVRDCDRMLDAAAAGARRLLVTHTLRCEFFVVTALARIAAGAIGRLTLGSFRWFTDEIARLDAPGHWKGTVAVSGGGVLIDGGCHVADLGNAFFGRALRVSAFGAKLVARREGLGEDTAVFSVEYASGALATFALSFTAGRGLRQEKFAAGLDADLFGSSGHLEGGYRIRDDALRRYLAEHHEGEADRVHVDGGAGSHGDIDARCIATLRDGATPPLTAVDARNAVAVVEAAYRSLERGEAAKVDWREPG